MCAFSKCILFTGGSVQRCAGTASIDEGYEDMGTVFGGPICRRNCRSCEAVRRQGGCCPPAGPVVVLAERDKQEMDKKLLAACGRWGFLPHSYILPIWC